MKKLVDISLKNVDSISGLLKSGIAGYHVDETNNSRPAFVYLMLRDCSTVKMYSTINEFNDWDAIGSLSIERTENADNEMKFVQVSEHWHKIKSISKLIIDDADVRVECGLKIENENSKLVYILPSSFPNSIELKAEFYNGSFDPECDIEEYDEDLLE